MKNAIYYYYELNPTEIHQIDKKYKFEINNQKYIIYPYLRTIKELKNVYDLTVYLRSIGIYCHKIILNKSNEIITNINGVQYVLLQVLKDNRKIEISDIMYYSNIRIDVNNYKNIKRTEWSTLWSKKIDYLEYQITQFGKKYKTIRESSDYYIGIVENCIQFLNSEKPYETIQTISHNRISVDETIEEFYNPLNFIIDSRIRDICEYIKTIIENENAINILMNFIYESKITKDEIKLILVRILYPSIYLDECEKIISKQNNELKLIQIIKYNNILETFIKNTYNSLRKIINLPEIEWLIKM